jgi:hypothetical protein
MPAELDALRFTAVHLGSNLTLVFQFCDVMNSFRTFKWTVRSGFFADEMPNGERVVLEANIKKALKNSR